jgi:hypothetical protein
LLTALVGMLFIAACVSVSPSETARVQEDVPDRASFPIVSDLLDHRCGTLDCHGNSYRNLRIYGREGLRLSPTDRPTSQPNTTTTAEYDQTFESLVTLEPETMSAVVLDHGQDPERLTFIRKARGTEDHKGSTIWAEGSPEDLCVTSWLAGQVDVATCMTAYNVR